MFVQNLSWFYTSYCSPQRPKQQGDSPSLQHCFVEAVQAGAFKLNAARQSISNSPWSHLGRTTGLSNKKGKW